VAVELRRFSSVHASCISSCMFSQIRVRRQKDFGLTTLELRGRDNEVQIKLISRLGMRERRDFVRSFLAQIRPWIRYFHEPIIDHSDRGAVRERPVGRWKVATFRSSPVSTLPGAFGFEIRNRRRELGLTQAECARRLEIQRTHLSEIERGIHLPNAGTRGRIDEVLGIRGG
jgi:DNA-binding XRE family transcriptional regulator